jgi:hypothetical protein
LLTVSAGQRAGHVLASLAFHWDKPDELLTSLQDGLESRIVFTARLYEKRTGLLSIRGDRLLAQSSIVRRAHRDILTQQYIVVDDEGVPLQEYETPGALLPGFLNVPEIVFAGPLPEAGEMYVSARATLEPVRLMPPLTLVALIGTAAAYVTPWTRSEVR